MLHRMKTAIDYSATFDRDTKEVLVLSKDSRPREEAGEVYLPSSQDFHRSYDNDPLKSAKAVATMYATALYLVGEVGVPYEMVLREFSKVPEFGVFDVSPLSRMHSEDIDALRLQAEKEGLSEVAELLR